MLRCPLQRFRFFPIMRASRYFKGVCVFYSKALSLPHFLWVHCGKSVLGDYKCWNLSLNLEIAFNDQKNALCFDSWYHRVHLDWCQIDFSSGQFLWSEREKKTKSCSVALNADLKRKCEHLTHTLWLSSFSVKVILTLTNDLDISLLYFGVPFFYSYTFFVIRKCK